MRKDWLSHLSASRNLSSGLAILALVIQSISVIMIFMPLEAQAYETWQTISILIFIVFMVCTVILAFQVRRILIQHYNENLGMNIGFSGLATFFWQEWYLQYKLNRLPISGERSVDLVEVRQ